MVDEPVFHDPLPVSGYVPQSATNVELVNTHKEWEETVLRRLDWLASEGLGDPRWVAIGRTHLELAFMAINRAVFQPQRVSLPEDAESSVAGPGQGESEQRGGGSVPEG